MSNLYHNDQFLNKRGTHANYGAHTDPELPTAVVSAAADDFLRFCRSTTSGGLDNFRIRGFDWARLPPLPLLPVPWASEADTKSPSASIRFVTLVESSDEWKVRFSTK